MNEIITGRCVARKTWDYETRQQNGKYVKKRMWTKGDVFNFHLEDGWLYILTDDKENIIHKLQYALFYEYFDNIE